MAISIPKVSKFSGVIVPMERSHYTGPGLGVGPGTGLGTMSLIMPVPFPVPVPFPFPCRVNVPQVSVICLV